MTDKDVIIGLKTTGDTSGADDVRESIFKVEDAAKQAERELDVMEAKARKIGPAADVPGKPPAAGSPPKPAVPIENAAVSASVLNARFTAITAAVAALGAISKAIFGKLKEDVDAATAAGSRWEIQNIKTAAAIHLLGDPVGVVKEGWKTIGTTITGWIDKIVLKDGIAKTQLELNAVSVEAAKKSSFEQTAAAHAAMNQKILAADLKLQEAQDKLARSREERAGVKAEQTAANEIERIIKKNAAENQLIITAIAEAQRKQAAALADLKDLNKSNEEKEGARKIYQDTKKELVDLQLELRTKIQTDAVALQDSVEGAQDASKKAVEARLTANAETLQAELQKIVDAKGNDASALTQLAFKSVNDILAKDGAELVEANKLEAAIRAFYQSPDSNTGKLRETAQKLLDDNKKAVETNKALNDQVTAAVGTLGESQQTITQNVAVAQEKATEVKTALDGARTNTVQAIQAVAPTPQDTAAITKAVQEVGRSISEQGNATITALAAVSAAVGQITNRIAQQQAQINQLQARVR